MITRATDPEQNRWWTSLPEGRRQEAHCATTLQQAVLDGRSADGGGKSPK